jgi:hypothetical protein
VSLRHSGASSFEKVLRDADEMSTSHHRYPIQSFAPLEMGPGHKGTASAASNDKQHDLGPRDGPARMALSWEGGVGSSGYVACRVSAQPSPTPLGGPSAAGRLYLERAPTPPRVEPPMITSPRR